MLPTFICQPFQESLFFCVVVFLIEFALSALVPESDLFFLTSLHWTSECFLRWTLNIVPPHIVIVIFQTDVLDGVLSLWKSVAAFGLMGEVLSTLQTELLAMFKGVEDRTEKTNLLEAGETWLKCFSVPANLLSEMFLRV